MIAERTEIEQFLYREARLLDTQRFEEWLDLFAEDACYWVPAGHDDIDPTVHVSIIHDDKAAMARRVKAAARSGHALCAGPGIARPSDYFQCPRSASPILVNNLLEVNNMMLLVELARHRQTIHSARCEFCLERQTQGLADQARKGQSAQEQ